MVAKKIAVTEQPVAKKIAVTEQVDEASVNVAPSPDEPVIKEEAEQEPLTDIPEPGPREPEAAHHRYESRSLDRLASRPRPLLHIKNSHTRGLARQVKHRSRAAGLWGIALILVIVGVYALVKPTSGTNPLPQSVQQKVKFTVYYPKSSAGKYQYLADSSSYKDGKLTYNLGTGDSLIHVSEQALSVQPPDLHKLQNFSVFQAPAGEAAVGANGNILNGVLIADKTLVILNGLGGVNMQDFMQTINAMQP